MEFVNRQVEVAWFLGDRTVRLLTVQLVPSLLYSCFLVDRTVRLYGHSSPSHRENFNLYMLT